MISKVRVWVVTLVGILILIPAAGHTADLGIGVKPIPKYEIADTAELSNNSRLWFIVEPGTSKSREILLIGSPVPQRVKLEVLSALESNGEISLTSETSSFSKFFRFSENNFVLGANENKVINVEINVPKETPSQSTNAFLTVSVVADSLSSNKTKAKSNIQAVVKNQIRTGLRMFIGIGSYKDFYSDFEIREIKDYSIRGSKFIDIYIENTGKTPITPQGDLTFSSLDFPGLRFGPFSYLTLSIEPGEVGKFKLRIADEITPGNWQVLAKAQQGNILKTKIFERNLKFREGLDWINIGLRLLALITALILMYYLRRSFSISKKMKYVEQDKGKKRLSIDTILDSIKKSRKPDLQPDEFIGSFSFLLDEIERQSTAKKSTAKKSTTKKSTTKKSTTKKSTTKKSTTKKSTTKKSTTKKSTTKKSTTKKSTTKRK